MMERPGTRTAQEAVMAAASAGVRPRAPGARAADVLTVIPRVVTQPHDVGSGELHLGFAPADADQGRPQAEGGRSGFPFAKRSFP
jgi:hypothetical protein